MRAQLRRLPLRRQAQRQGLAVRIRLALELRIERRLPPTPEREQQFEHRDNDGTLVENIGHPRYVGFTAEPTHPEEHRR